MPRKSGSPRPRGGGAGVPPWVHDIGTAVWISGPDRRIRYINARAERLLELPALEGVGQPCHKLIAGMGPSRTPFCGRVCPAFELARNGHPIPPFDLTIDGHDGNVRRIHLLVIPTHCREEDALMLVHCAFDRDKTFRMERYLASLAARVDSRSRDAGEPASGALTTRERDVLRMMSRGKDLRAIAEKMDLSYHTVRNHVQHILEKLGAHSMKEAIAAHLLRRDRRN
jgi:DNA-binding CsgD family transcriptional regulator